MILYYRRWKGRCKWKQKWVKLWLRLKKLWVDPKQKISSAIFTWSSRSRCKFLLVILSFWNCYYSAVTSLNCCLSFLLSKLLLEWITYFYQEYYNLGSESYGLRPFTLKLNKNLKNLYRHIYFHRSCDLLSWAFTF